MFDCILEFREIQKGPYEARAIFTDGASPYIIFAADFNKIAKLMIDGKIDGAWLISKKWGKSCLKYLGPRGTRPDPKQSKIKVKVPMNIKVDDE
jgi:hypothetical protein